jgi:UDP-N-acetylglucosamine pyrophosphorylase
MAQDVGPILEMVTEKYLLRSKKEWESRNKALSYFENVLDLLKKGKIKEIASFTQKNFEGPIQEIIPWASNLYTESIIQSIQKEFGDDFWGFWMMGGMSGGGMGFMFEPKVKEKAKDRLLDIMNATKNVLEKSVAFGMNPLVYNFEINETGTSSHLFHGTDALMPSSYYNLIAPKLLRKEAKYLTPLQRIELEIVSDIYKKQPNFNSFISNIFEQLIPQNNKQEGIHQNKEDVLIKNGFDINLHQQIKNDLKAGRIGLAQNRLPATTKIEDVALTEIKDSINSQSEVEFLHGINALKNGELAILTLAGGVGSRWTNGAGVVKSLNPFIKMNGIYRNFIDIHCAKNNFIANKSAHKIQHVISTSYMTNEAISNSKTIKEKNLKEEMIYLSPGQFIGQKLIPTERDLRFLWEEMPQQDLDEQAQKVRHSLRNALINWAKESGEAEDYNQNTSLQCVHPVGHWFEFPNMMINGTLHQLISENPSLNYILIHNIDTLGANPDPSILGQHILSNKSMSVEVIKRNIDDHGGGLAKVNGTIRLVEGMALPNEEIEFNLSYYNTNTFWITIDDILKAFNLKRSDLSNQQKVKREVLNLSKRMPSYITVKDVKKRWGKGQEDIYPVIQFEKIWGDMTAFPEIECNYILVDRNRGQQLKEVDQLDGWLRDGSAKYIESICKWD